MEGTGTHTPAALCVFGVGGRKWADREGAVSLLHSLWSEMSPHLAAGSLTVQGLLEPTTGVGEQAG